MIVAFLGRGDGSFEQHLLFAAGDPSVGSSGIQLVDLDGDQDLAGVRADSLVVVMWNTGGNVNRRLLVELVGPRGTRDGSGARLELHVGSLVQSVEVGEQPVWLGLQRETKLGVVRIVWPDGTVENHLDVPVPQRPSLRFTRGARSS